MGTAPFSLLRILADGRFHSGERLGRTLGLSRAGVWNLIRRVEALGLRVFKVRGRGYRLAEALDLFESPALAARSKKIAPELCIEVLDECPSTNTVLAQRAAAGAPHGTVLACEHQSAGRGRRGNSWVSEVGGSLAFSILWRFPRGAGALGGLSLAVAVGAAKALERLGTQGVGVKWPNDLYCEGCKLGGILIESSGDILGPSAVVVGVGLNVRLGTQARGRIGGPVTDIASHSKPIPSRTAVFVESLESIAGVLERFSREGFAPFRQQWLQRHAWQGRRVVLSQAGRRVAEGKCVGVAEDGALMLASVEGMQRFHSGELSLGPG
jgi:BirA family biotin operon repressor/biotin-[acetyl-CoA-carboxylase] ligase